ncbi:MAG: hypothetical protein JW731_16265 [Bacteroidales bacterium]|nr:hypothetical protein [Bacteroidales bacterium]
MAIFSKKDFQRLSDIKAKDSATFYIPTYRDSNNQKAKIIFKNQYNDIRKKLESHDRGETYINNYFESLNKLADDPFFWRHLSDGLIVFHNMELTETYELQVFFDDFHYFGNRFLLTPSIPYFNGNGRFYLLAISQNQTRLFEGSRDEIGPIDISGLIPQQLEDTVGYDFEQKSLQFRTENTSSGNVQFHGHGAGKDDKDEELLRFLRDIDRGFTSFAGKNGRPLIIASVDNIFANYKKITQYKNLHKENISGNPDESDILLLHEKTWDLLKGNFNKQKQEAIDEYRKYQNTGKTLNNIEKIISQSEAGNIDTLFIKKGEYIWGNYDEQMHEVKTDELPSEENICLTDLACKNTFLQDGQVFLVDPDEMPDPDSHINALMRFDPS